MKLKYIPNILSCIRLAMVGIFIFVFFLDDYEYHTHLAFFVFGLACLTDVVDGYLARKNNWVTTMGKILDPLADKLMQCTVLICLAFANMVELWFIMPYILKELIMLIGGLMLMKKSKVVVVSNVFGKLAAVIFFCTIAVIMLFSKPMPAGDAMPVWVTVLCIISLTCTVAALIIYMFQYLAVKPQQQIHTGDENKVTEKK